MTSSYFGQKVDGVIPYGVVGSTIVINGDPICADSDFPVLLAEFKEFLPAQLTTVFISVTDHFWKNIRSRLWMGQKRGGSPFHLADYEISGKKRRQDADEHQPRPESRGRRP